MYKVPVARTNDLSELGDRKDLCKGARYSITYTEMTSQNSFCITVDEMNSPWK